MYAARSMCGTSYQVAPLKITSSGRTSLILPSAPDREPGRLVHPGVGRHDRERAAETRDRDRDAAQEVDPRRQAVPAVDVDRDEDRLEEEEDAPRPRTGSRRPPRTAPSGPARGARARTTGPSPTRPRPRRSPRRRSTSGGRAAAHPRRRGGWPRASAISIIAGRATPRQARTMWNPRVSAIWLRAASRSAGEAAARSGNDSATRVRHAGSIAGPRPPRSAAALSMPIRHRVRTEQRRVCQSVYTSQIWQTGSTSRSGKRAWERRRAWIGQRPVFTG